MTKRRAFNRQQIVDATLGLIRDKDWRAVSARSVAAHVGSSTMPLYSAVGSIEALEEEVWLAALQVQIASQRRPRTDNPLLDAAIGYVAFARDEPNLFRFLWVERPRPLTEALHQRLARQNLRDATSDDWRLEAFIGEQDPTAMDALSFKAWVFTHGLATLVGDGVLADLGDQRITQLLSEAGDAFWMWEQQAPG